MVVALHAPTLWNDLLSIVRSAMYNFFYLIFKQCQSCSLLRFYIVINYCKEPLILIVTFLSESFEIFFAVVVVVVVVVVVISRISLR